MNIVSLFVPAFTAVGGVIGAWLHGRYSRKVRLKVCPEGIEVEAQTIKQMRDALVLARLNFPSPRKMHEYSTADRWK